MQILTEKKLISENTNLLFFKQTKSKLFSNLFISLKAKSVGWQDHEKNIIRIQWYKIIKCSMKFCQGSFLFVMTLVMKTVGIQYCKRAIYQRNCVGKKKKHEYKRRRRRRKPVVWNYSWKHFCWTCVWVVENASLYLVYTQKKNLFGFLVYTKKLRRHLRCL